MQTFTCSCGNRLFFENTRCTQCGKETGFAARQLRLVPLDPAANNTWTSEQLPGQVFRKCNNYIQHNACNWLVPVEDANGFCLSCRLNKIIPDLNKPENLTRWQRLERAKRRMLYNLYRLGLQVPGRHEQPQRGLEFCFLEDVKGYDAYSQELITYEHITTGHNTGTITINVEEADHVLREAMRENMNESYRTPLGHLRHEVGHFYWDRLIANTQRLESFRELFGDERHDYQQSLQHYYQYGPRANWQENFISAYASAHPWEDWAESWAHYLHITDTMETAYDFGFSIEGNAIPQPLVDAGKTTVQEDNSAPASGFDDILISWMRLTLAMNALNRSMGLRDAYPFYVSEKVSDKLRYVHSIVTDCEFGTAI